MNSQETMRAVVLTAIGGPENMEVTAVPVPGVGPHEVLVEVHTVSVNHQDVYAARGKANIGRMRLPHIHGIDPAGTIAALGSEVDRFEIGDRVVTKPSIGCQRCSCCLRGEDDSCENLTSVSIHRQGGMAEFVAVPARNVFPIPDILSFESATAIAHSFPVALLMLREKAVVHPDDVVLVSSASGAIGAACVQLAKIFGATVIAAAGSSRGAAYGAELGADMIIDYGSDPLFAANVREAFPEGVSVYVESAGNPAVWVEALKTLGRRARVTVCGAHAGPIVDLDLKWLFRSRVSVLGSSGSSLRGFQDIIDLAGKGRLVANIDSVWPLEDAKEAFVRLMSGQNRGKVILQVTDG